KSAVPTTAHSKGKLKMSIIADKNTAKINATKKTDVPIANRSSASLAINVSPENHMTSKRRIKAFVN
ncbi:MAG: hypothetical protein ACPL0C_00865, partial [Candidatus Bathyarchaeales archaeon]